MTDALRYHEASEADKPGFVERGYKGRYFFPHRVCYLPKLFPEQRLIAKNYWGLDSFDGMYGALLYAQPEQVAEFPDDLWLDRGVMVHRAHMGRPGLVASAHLYINGEVLYTDEHQSDMVQRAGERPETRNKVVRRYGSWHYMLLNAVLHFAEMRGLREVHVPTAERVLSNYIKHEINTDLIERLYDRDITLHHLAERRGGVWVIDVQANREKLVSLHARSEPLGVPDRRVCVVHDIAPTPGSASPRPPIGLDRMLEAERGAGVRCTYSVPGVMLASCRDRIEGAGHDLAFHSYLPGPYRYRATHTDVEPAPVRAVTQVLRRVVHRLRRRGLLRPGETPTATELCNAFMNRLRTAAGRPPLVNPLYLCRDADFYIKGYRPTANDAPAGLDESLLAELHFEWVIREAAGDACDLMYERGLLTLPVRHFDAPGDVGDDPQWRDTMLASAEREPLTVVGLPSANASGWLADYPGLLAGLLDRAELVTAEDLANAYHLARAV